MSSNKPSFLSRMRTSDKVLLGVVTVLLVLTIVLNILQGFGLSLINQPVMLFVPVLALFVLVAWGFYALVRRISSRGVRLTVGIVAAMLAMLVMIVGYTYLSFLTYTVMPHKYSTLTDADGGHRMVVLWQFDMDSEHSEASIAQRKAARLEAYPDSGEDTRGDDFIVTFQAYPQVAGLFYRSKADVQGKVYLAYTGNVGQMDYIEPAEGSDAEPVVIKTPHGTMMLEWLDDNSTAHFYVKDPGVAEGGECTVKF